MWKYNFCPNFRNLRQGLKIISLTKKKKLNAGKYFSISQFENKNDLSKFKVVVVNWIDMGFWHSIQIKWNSFFWNEISIKLLNLLVFQTTLT